MKKLIILLFGVIMFATSLSSCTEQKMARKFGGSGTIELPKGQKLLEVTWKDDNLWYLTEPMEEGYVPKTKVFQEDSSWDVFEGKVTFIESR